MNSGDSEDEWLDYQLAMAVKPSESSPEFARLGLDGMATGHPPDNMTDIKMVELPGNFCHKTLQ